jgi:predicted dehydrogenase
MSETIRLGIIGLGAMGTRMLNVATEHPDFTVALACDVNPAAADRLPDAMSFTTNPQEVVKAADLDAVYIATPPAYHAELTVAAMRSGKAVFCEKPLAVSLADGQRMLQVAEETGLANAVNFALSDRSTTTEVARSLRAGEVGEVVGVDVRLSFPLWPRTFQADATWLARREQGGFVREVFSHFAYLTDRLLGPLRTVESSVDYPDDPHASEVAARGLLRSGDVAVQVSAFSGVAAPELYEWILWGTRRSYMLRNWAQLYVSDGDGWTEVEPQGDKGSEATRLSLFAKAIAGERSDDLAGFAAAFRVQEVVEAFLV